MLKTCENCKQFKEHHALNLCKPCYLKLYPGKRPVGFCLSHECLTPTDLVEIWARGLCHSCYCREQQRGTLDLYPKTAGYRTT